MLQQKVNVKFFIFILCILAAGLVSCYVGPSSDWDLVSYHYYNAYAVLNNRIGYDFMPAGIQSYLNPVLDLINYFIINIFRDNKNLVMFLLGIPLGFFYFSIYLISDLLFANISKDRVITFLLIGFAVVVGSTECIIVAEIAKSYNDIHVSAMLLFSLYFCLKFSQDPRRKYIVYSGLLIGIACGCKLTSAPSSIVLYILFPFFNPAKDIKQKLIDLSWLVFWSAFAFFVVNGYWMWFIYKHFHNPFFPMFNAIFKSDLYSFVNYRDMHFVDITWRKIFFYPLFWSYHKDSFVFETPFYDFRHKLTYFACIFSPLLMYYRYKIKKAFSETDKMSVFIFAFAVLGYLIWIKTSGVIRYLMPILALSGVMMTMYISSIKFLSRKVLVCIVVALAFCVQWLYESPNLGSSKNNELITPPELEIEDNSVVLILGKPLGYFAAKPYKNVRFIALANLQDGDAHDFRPSKLYYDKIDEVIKNKKVYLLTNYRQPYFDYFKTDPVLKKYVNDDLDCEFYNYEVTTFYFNLNSTYFCSYVDKKSRKNKKKKKNKSPKNYSHVY
ncbi:MAG: hypothetical protein K6C94_05715 [Candidatus Gastranaerophilales bacterium]|nr:hypothetical protein [Candidatus Gastranaerophilales bacterium]